MDIVAHIVQKMRDALEFADISTPTVVPEPESPEITTVRAPSIENLGSTRWA